MGVAPGGGVSVGDGHNRELRGVSVHHSAAEGLWVSSSPLPSLGFLICKTGTTSTFFLVLSGGRNGRRGVNHLTQST